MADVAGVVLTVYDIVSALKQFFDKDNDGEILPREVTDLIESFSDGDKSTNDIETLLTEIKDSLMYNEEYTALSEISSRLEVIDTRLDKEFQTLNVGLTFIMTALTAILSWKFLGWLTRLISV
ncbi:MAG: hypothetical protein NC253_01510 [Ruminococcus sp.]|nr:hypothetical protein [Ruminococcus sp.]MCM1381158.1 hypothetical protein [Muribaculaceae bacterium]MCM1479649.1 hypothetical protein [Muribaculaceae bacterium]